MKAGSKLQFHSMHLHANGARTGAHLRVGFKFHPRGYEPTRKWVRMSFGNGVDLDIEAMDPDQQAEAYFTLPENALITIFEPHMHAPGVRRCLDAIWGHTVQTLTAPATTTVGCASTTTRTMRRRSCRRAPSCG